jgi:hypothetical protein
MFIFVLGIAFLIFRIWIVEFKLEEELQFRRRYFSRFFSYYTCLALVFSLRLWPFNVMVMVAFPILVVTSVWDINFFRRVNYQDYWKTNLRWGIIERSTLHPPVVVVAIYMILSGARSYIQPPNLILMALTIIGLFLPFLLLDVRWTERYKWPEAIIVIGLVIASGVSLLVTEAILWGVPIW